MRRLPPFARLRGLAQPGYRGRLTALAMTAAGFPLLALLLAMINPAVAGTLLLLSAIASAMSVAALVRKLRPLDQLACDLAGCAGGDATDGAPGPARMLADLARIARQFETLRHRAIQRHPLTDLPTREPFFALLDQDIAAGAAPAVLGTLRFADHDRLAAFDQQVAERALRAFAVRLQQAVGKDRPLAHVDRDCFAIWLREADTAPSELQAIAYALGQEIADGELRFSPEVEAGAALYPNDATDPAMLLTRAVVSLAKPQRSGTGAATFFSAESAAVARERFSVEQELRHAIARDQLELHLQPVVDLAAARLCGAEALLRWRHPELGLVPPSRFIPIAEEIGLADEVGQWILNTACREARAWDKAGLEDMRMVVNLSARQLRDPKLHDMIVRTLELHRLPAQRLELELTETAALEDAPRTVALFGALRELGVSLAIDDFGTGYSSLSYVKNLPFDKLKIDREFVSGADRRRDSRAICRALIELADGLGIEVLAEGIETRGEVEALSALGCTLFQGYFFSAPLPADLFLAKVRDPAWIALLASPVHRRLAGLEQRMRA